MLSKEIFIEMIEFIRDRNDAQNKIDKLFRDEFTDGLFWPYMKYEAKMCKLLAHIMGDEETAWIDYFCWERDFGRDTKLGDVKEADGTPIPFKNAEDLYNLLITNMQNKKGI